MVCVCVCVYGKWSITVDYNRLGGDEEGMRRGGGVIGILDGAAEPPPGGEAPLPSKTGNEWDICF